MTIFAPKVGISQARSLVPATKGRFYVGIPVLSTVSHQRLGGFCTARRWQGTSCSRSNDAIFSTAVDTAAKTGALKLLPSAQDWGTTPTTMTFEGARPANRNCARHCASPGS